MHTCFCDGGLANRLNGLFFALALKDRYGHDWEISWAANNWCGASFASLFESDLPVRQYGLQDIRDRQSDYWFVVHENQAGVDPARITFTKSLSSFEEYRRLLDVHPNVFCTFHLLPPFVAPADIVNGMAALRVAPGIVLAAANFCLRHKIDRSVFGLHIRKTDFGDLVNDGELLETVRNSSDRFFVCSDDAGVNERFGALPNCYVYPKTHFPEKLDETGGWNAWIVDTEGRRFPFNVNRSEASIVEAFIDLLILSQTSPVQTSHSTFFQMAMLFANTAFLPTQAARLADATAVP